MRELFDLWFAFFKIGCVNFGGGYAMLPLLEKDLVKKRGWTTMDELTDYYAIGQCTPGIIALNVSTFIGYRRKGTAGAFTSTLGFLTGPIAIIILIAAFLKNFAQMPVVQHAFAGIRICVCVLILQAIVKLWKKSVVDKLSFLLYLIVFFFAGFSAILPFKVPAAILVIAAGVFGIFFGKSGQDSSAPEKTKEGKA